MTDKRAKMNIFSTTHLLANAFPVAFSRTLLMPSNGSNQASTFSNTSSTEEITMAKKVAPTFGNLVMLTP